MVMQGHNMKCPYCQSAESRIKDSLASDGRFWRRRKCSSCGGRYTTVDIVGEAETRNALLGQVEHYRQAYEETLKSYNIVMEMIRDRILEVDALVNDNARLKAVAEARPCRLCCNRSVCDDNADDRAICAKNEYDDFEYDWCSLSVAAGTLVSENFRLKDQLKKYAARFREPP